MGIGIGRGKRGWEGDGNVIGWGMQKLFCDKLVVATAMMWEVERSGDLEREEGCKAAGSVVYCLESLYQDMRPLYRRQLSMRDKYGISMG